MFGWYYNFTVSPLLHPPSEYLSLSDGTFECAKRTLFDDERHPYFPECDEDQFAKSFDSRISFCPTGFAVFVSLPSRTHLHS